MEGGRDSGLGLFLSDNAAVQPGSEKPINDRCYVHGVARRKCNEYIMTNNSGVFLFLSRAI